MIFRTLAVSKFVYLALITNVPKVIVEKLQRIQKKKKKKKKKSYSKTHVLK